MKKKLAQTSLILALSTSVIGHENEVKAADKNQPATDEVNQNAVTTDTRTQNDLNNQNDHYDNHQSD
ncbi:hypothetical protein Q0M59_16495, partial [Staphylococcus aureus]|nr:hypothetical protein [Staphylococcus aureus]